MTPPAPVPAAVGSLRVSGKVVVCSSRRCRSRTGSLSFTASAATNVTVSLRRQTCARCAWRPAGTTTVAVSRGGSRWRISRTVAGLRLRPGRHELTLTAPAGPAAVAFAVRGR